LGEADNHLTDADDLSRVRLDRANDPVIIRLHLGVAEILTGLDLPGARRVEFGLRGLEGLERLIVATCVVWPFFRSSRWRYS
jgi:hypothetical protein